MSASGTSGCDVVGELDSLCRGVHGQQAERVVDGVAQEEIDRVQLERPASILEKSRMSLR